MDYTITLHGLILFVTAIMCLIVGANAWQRRYYQAGKILTLFMAAIFIYTFCSAMQAGITSLSANIMWAKISYTGYVWLTPLFFLFIMAYIDPLKRVNLSILAAIGTIPLLTLILAWTNEHHRFIWSAFIPGDKELNIVIFEHGPWFRVFLVFQVCLYGLTLVQVIRHLRTQEKPYRQQSLTFLVATLLPALAGLMYGLDISPIPGLDWMPILSFFSAFLFYWNIFHYRLLDLIPIARHILIEQMLDGMLVLDETQRIIDINQNARRMIRQGEKVKIGDSLSTALPELAVLLSKGRPASNQTLAILETPETHRVIEVRFTSIIGDKTGVKGSLLILMDITERKAMEDSLNQKNQELEAQIKNIQELEHQLREESIRDPLTSLYNRRYLEESLRREFALAQRRQYPISIILADIDHFKRINDTFGHSVGDEVLQQLSKLLLSSYRLEDIICRYGGEEFLIVMPTTCNETAVARAEVIRENLEKTVITAGEQEVQITLSAGVATYPDHGSSTEEIIKTADRALYHAKSAGRNRVVSGRQSL